MKVFIVYFLFCLSVPVLYGQDSVTVILELIDKQNEEFIRNAKIEITSFDSSCKLVSNGNGEASFMANPGASFQIHLSHFKYEAKSYRKRIPNTLDEDTVKYTLDMQYIRTQNIQELVVAAPGIPVVEYGSDRLHVSDYEFLKNGDLLLLTYPKRLKKGSSLVVWDGQKVKTEFLVDNLAEELIHDFRGNPHIVCENAVYGVHPDEGKIGLSTMDKEYYFKYVAPIVDTNKSKMYFSNFNKDYPAFDYFTFDRLDSAYTKILQIEDELMMELYRSEIKWVDVRTRLWAKNKEIKTGIDAEIWVGANYFTQSPYYKELYAPLFHRNDTLFVFDYYKDMLRTFDAIGTPVDSVQIDHHYGRRKSGWKSELIQDRKTGQIYALYDRDGFTYLGWINTRSGQVVEQVKLEYKYAHDIQVFNNHVYYVYRPFESSQKKYLYKERLPYEFSFVNSMTLE